MKTLFFFNRSMIRFSSLICLMICLSLTANAQMPAAISIDPPNATAYDELTLTFDPAFACFQSGSLDGLASIAMHSGVTLSTGETWMYVIFFNAPGANGQYPTLLPTGDGRYYINYTPFEFYGFPEGTVVTQICAVFNNGSDWYQDGRDFVPGTSNCMDFFIPLNYSAEEPEFHFSLNMNKMILDGNFDPLSDQVNVEIALLGDYPLTDDNLDGIYEGIVDEGIVADSTYTYQFRINSDQYESITREVTAYAGVIFLEAWWNDEVPPLITFVIDMIYQAEIGNFYETDFVDVTGTINNWQGSAPMEHIGYFLYSITLIANPGPVEYLFRINGNPLNSEDFGPGVYRMTWAVAGEPYSVYHFFNDYNWNAWPVTFEVDMNAEIDAGNFDPENDFLDIAGSMNGWGSHYVLFDREWTGDGIYTVNMLIDIYNPYIEFKFRINGDWTTSEFPVGGPNRYWAVQDTTGGLVNLYECIYNLTDVPYAPYVYDVFIEGDLLVGEEITGKYTYFDPNADPEGISLYQWYQTSDSSGSDAVPIDGAVHQIYTINEEDFGKYLIFEVIPVAVSGDPLYGYPAYVFSDMIGAVNIVETTTNIIRIYPNPANDILNITSGTGLDRIEIFDLTGKLLYSINNSGSNKAIISLPDLKNGIYIVRCLDNSGDYFIKKIIASNHNRR
jgi:hypothetical protein